MDFIAGQFEEPQAPEGEIVHRSPVDQEQVTGRHPWSRVQVDRAVEAARRAQPGWARTPAERRFELLRRAAEQMTSHAEELARAITREVGKPLWEAREEAAACKNKVAVTLDEAARLIAPLAPAGLAGEARLLPLGVVAVLGPFNFPAHLPNGQVIPALAAGNAVVMKPSDAAPGVGALYARLLHGAGLPEGLFNLIQGGPEVGEALALHPGVDGVLFTGSYPVGSHLEARLAGSGKLLALEMGGKNPALLLDDAPLEKSIHDVLFGAFVSAGQRCTGTSRAIVHRSLLDAFCERLVRLAARLKVGHPEQEGTFMGPLATLRGLARFEEGQRWASESLAQVMLPSRFPAGAPPRGLFRTPSIHRMERAGGTRYEQEELFGPDLVVYPAQSDEEAVAIANGAPYGLAASVFTRSRDRFERCLEGLQMGCVNWNAPTVGASSRLPFGGIKRSGNHRPMGLFAILACQRPVAILRGGTEVDRARLAPGMALEDG